MFALALALVSYKNKKNNFLTYHNEAMDLNMFYVF